MKLLKDSYTRQKNSTKWQDTRSQSFDSMNGVRQGGILSPLLFTVYVDVLLKRLKENGMGCWIGRKYFGALSYADDICI